jgi:uncharacterized protein (TIGR02588 family)
MPGRPQNRTQKRETAYDVGKPTARPQQQPHATSDIPILEWLVGAAGLVLVIGVIVFMLYEAITGSQSPPDLKVSVVSVVPVQNGYLVNVKALNQGGSAAAAIVVEAELRKDSQLVERSEVTMDYAPPGSEKRGGLFFIQDPRQFDLQVRALGYEEP